MLARVVADLRAAGCVFAEDEARLLAGEARDEAALDRLVARRVAGTPLEQVLGWVAFCGLRVPVEPGVFVPRQRTELLVRTAAAQVPVGGLVVDLCCGCGAVGLAVLATSRAGELHAVDLDPSAVRCARRNLAEVGGHVHEGDLYDALPDRLRGRVDVLVANAPYVPRSALALLPREARLHEPVLALDGGPDGLDVQRRVLAAANDWLSPGGCVVVETGRSQAAGSVDAAEEQGLSAQVVADDAGTVVLGTAHCM